MSVSPLSICSFSGNHTTPPPNISRYRDTSASIVFPQQNTSSMFGSLKKKLTKRGSNPLKSAEMTNTSAGAASRGYLAPHNGNSLTSGAPPTRRPSMFALAVRCFHLLTQYRWPWWQRFHAAGRERPSSSIHCWSSSSSSIIKLSIACKHGHRR